MDLTIKDKNYLVRILDSRLKELEKNAEVIEDRFVKGLDSGKEYLININRNETTYIKVKTLRGKLRNE